MPPQRQAGASAGPDAWELADGAALLAATANVIMQLSWTPREQLLFGALMRAIVMADRLLPGPVRRFPFNACLYDLRARSMISGDPAGGHRAPR